MKKIILFIMPHLLFLNTAHSKLDFTNRNVHLALNPQKTRVRLGQIASITGWGHDSIINAYGNNTATSWTESYTNNSVIGSGGQAAPTNMVYNNSNTISVYQVVSQVVRTTSNALYTAIVSPTLLWKIKNNSNGINAFASPIKWNINNSNALIPLSQLIKNDSNATWAFSQNLSIFNNSNAIIAESRLQQSNSNVLAYTLLSRLIRTSSNTITAVSPTSLNRRMINNSNAINSLSNQVNLLAKNNSNSVNYFFRQFVTLIPAHSHFAASTTINNLSLYQSGFAIAAGKTLTLNTPLPANGNISLNNTGILSLGGDLYLGSNAYLTKAGSISGNGYSLIMTDSLTLPPSSTWQITSNLIINGNGSTLSFGANAQITLASNVSLTLKNMYIQTDPNNLTFKFLQCSNQTGIVTLDNVIFELASNFIFDSGRLFFNNDVRVTGTAQFVFKSPTQSYVVPESLLTFDAGTTLYYAPSSANKDLLQLVDESSGIYLKGPKTTLLVTATGIRLTKGRLWIDNKVTLQSTISAANIALTNGINFGNSMLGSTYDLDVFLLAGARVELNGNLFYNNVN